MSNSHAPTLSLPEVCRILGLSWPQAWRLVLRGELQGQQVRGRWLVQAASVADWKRRKSQTPRPAA